MMIPEAGRTTSEMDPARRAFYEFHSALMEPWDGPALVAFTDGSVIGAVLDRNGLRPGRYWVTDDGLVMLASEVGVLDIDPAVVRKGRLQPGRMFLVDTVAAGSSRTTRSRPSWPPSTRTRSGGRRAPAPRRPARARREVATARRVVRRQQAFGYTEEELRVILGPMARTGAEPIGSMGTDTPIAVLSDRPRLLFDYFTQLFAQVTNPPLDAIREELVTSLGRHDRPRAEPARPGPASCRQIVLPFPVLDNDELAKLMHINDDGDLPGFPAVRVHGRSTRSTAAARRCVTRSTRSAPR